MALTPEQVRHVAALARLSLSAEEERRYGQQLSAILDAVAQLQQLALEGVEPTSHATLAEGLLREDAPHASLAPERVLANAPERSGSSFVVPKVLE